jgi:asparagine synthase (glutamine-hydrolysing)
MCGILGIATTVGQRPRIEPAAVAHMRDTMTHRGPDGVGFWDGGHVILAHRRLAVVDPTPAGAQPMLTPDGRCALVYNGELYNDAELRGELAALGVRFATSSDTETVLHALATWGPNAVGRLRGMFALGFFDARTQSLLLARDPLGIKPLYYRLGRLSGLPGVVFASEIPAILAHPDISAKPDLVTVSAYLTTIRTVLGSRTLFQDVSLLRPGEQLLLNLQGPEIQAVRSTSTPRTLPCGPSDDPVSTVRHAVEDSVRRHLRSDVPLCCLLSGGLDSSIIATLAMRSLGTLHTYCSGAASTCDQTPEQRDSEDFAFARRVAGAIGSVHTEVPISPWLFTTRWREMVQTLGTPLSTPNEVAIHEVSRRLRSDGHIVTLSGEGADELFAGYASPMVDALAYIQDSSSTRPTPGTFQLLSNAWVQPEVKATILSERTWRSVERDEHLIAFYEAEFAAIAAEREDDSPLQAHLRFHRRINLAGLLQRLDTSTMLASVEGRTPFADASVCAIAESLPITDKFGATTPGQPIPAIMTKRVLRHAFAPDLPPEVISRPKASFPLPFQDWVADQAQALQQCDLVRDLFTPAALHAVTSNPCRLWSLSWPMINIALWARRWW